MGTNFNLFNPRLPLSRHHCINPLCLAAQRLSSNQLHLSLVLRLDKEKREKRREEAD